MVRAPAAACCEEMGLKKGTWTPEEDHILTTYIQHHGHGNWRALPKLAGLLRCGKSCRLRWINYLRPDIKRGNFTKEEQENIIKLHQTLGNRWSAIAARLPGRTDNEIKNFWHTHLKKRSMGASDSNGNVINSLQILPTQTHQLNTSNDSHDLMNQSDQLLKNWSDNKDENHMEFWYRLFVKAEEPCTADEEGRYTCHT